MQEKSWEIKEIPTWVSQKEASALKIFGVVFTFGNFSGILLFLDSWNTLSRQFGV